VCEEEPPALNASVPEFRVSAMAGEDVDHLEGGGLRDSVDPVLFQPLVEGSRSEVAVAQKTRLASLDVFRGLAIVVRCVVQDHVSLFLNPSVW
jgi:hypothetical protein